MNKIKIENFTQLNKLVAEQLGYIKYTWTDVCSQFSPGAEWNYGGKYYEQTYTAWITEEVYNRTEEEWEKDYDNSSSKYYHYSDLEEYINDKWLYTIPNFSSNYEAMEIIVEYLIEKGLEVELYKRKDYSVASIYEDTETPVYYGNKSFAKNEVNSLPLSLCLAFLEYKDIEVELML